MALCLLRFHDAPPNFRRQVLSTLGDEQRHAQAYLQRMRACGIDLGDRPVNGTFWNHLKGMSSVEEYCSGMALTLEQANLDFALHFEQQFREAGDLDTAELLREVRLDEIFHVRVGVQFLQNQLEPNQKLWDLWTHHLKPPLSPSRAKAYEIDTEGRLRAGLDSAFIAQLTRYERSKGRPPRVFLFNGLAEEEFLGGMPSRQRIEIDKDFQTSMFALAHNDDIVLVDSPPSAAFLDCISSAGFARPEWILRNEKKLELGHQKIASLHPWAWSPKTWLSFKPWWSAQTQIDTQAWKPNELIRKSGAHLKKGELDFLPASKFHQPSCEITNLSESDSGLAHLPEDILIKPSLSASGHGHLAIRKSDLSGSRSFENLLRRQHSLIAEPRHQRRADFSHPATYDGKKIQWLGSTRMLVDSKGRYHGAWLGGLFDGLSSQERRELHNPNGHPVWSELHLSWEPYLIKHFDEINYRGPFSIDSYLHTEDSGLRYRGCCELNLRTTFGHIALALQKVIRKGHRGVMAMIPMDDWERIPSPREFEDTREGEAGCWTSGLFPLNDLWQTSFVSLFMAVESSHKEIELLLKSMTIKASSHIHERIDLGKGP